MVNPPDPSTTLLIHSASRSSTTHTHTSNSSQLKSEVNDLDNWFAILYADKNGKLEAGWRRRPSLLLFKLSITPPIRLSPSFPVCVPVHHYLWLISANWIRLLCNSITLSVCHSMAHAHCHPVGHTSVPTRFSLVLWITVCDYRGHHLPRPSSVTLQTLRDPGDLLIFRILQGVCVTMLFLFVWGPAQVKYTFFIDEASAQSRIDQQSWSMKRTLKHEAALGAVYL